MLRSISDVITYIVSLQRLVQKSAFILKTNDWPKSRQKNRLVLELVSVLSRACRRGALSCFELVKKTLIQGEKM